MIRLHCSIPIHIYALLVPLYVLHVSEVLRTFLVIGGIESTHVAYRLNPQVHLIGRTGHQIIGPLFCLNIKDVLVLSMEERGVDADAVLEINDALEV